MIIIINGSVGVGKTSVADHLHYKFEKSVHLDGDAIGDVHPFIIYDDARISYLYCTLAHLIDFHQQNDYRCFVINYVFENPESLEQLLNLLNPLDADIHTYWLTCSEEEQARRIRGRGRDEIKWELERFIELHKIQAAAAQRGFIGKPIDTSGMSVPEVADEIWEDVHTQA